MGNRGNIILYNPERIFVVVLVGYRYHFDTGGY